MELIHDAASSLPPFHPHLVFSNIFNLVNDLTLYSAAEARNLGITLDSNFPLTPMFSSLFSPIHFYLLCMFLFLNSDTHIIKLDQNYITPPLGCSDNSDLPSIFHPSPWSVLKANILILLPCLKHIVGSLQPLRKKKFFNVTREIQPDFVPSVSSGSQCILSASPQPFCLTSLCCLNVCPMLLSPSGPLHMLLTKTDWTILPSSPFA